MRQTHTLSRWMHFRLTVLGPWALVVFAVSAAGGQSRGPQDIMILRAPADIDVGLALRDRGARRDVSATGVVVSGVVDGSAADVVGIRARDVIEAIGDVDVKSAKQLRAAFADAPPGTPVKLKIRRGRALLDVSLIPRPLVR